MNTAELNCKWHFAPQLGGRQDGPNDPMQESFKKTPFASLVRESIQNSLDVPLDGDKPVRVEYSISRIQAMSYPNFFELRKHINGCIHHFPTNDDAKSTYQPMLDYFDEVGQRGNLYYIKISDYNTEGMNYIKGQTDTPFFAFVRAAGVSAKKNAYSGGSFGYGKAAYFYISKIRTVMVNTQTKDHRHFFEGVASLCTHDLEGHDEDYVSVGYYDNNEGNPITNTDNIPTRFNKRDEPGTDIYILGIDASDKDSIYQEMTEAVLRNFWFSIYRNHLEVKIGENEINSSNLKQIMDEYFTDELDTRAKERKYNPKPYLDAVMNVGNDKQHILIEDNLPTLGNVKLYAVKNKLATDKILYMRRPLMLVKAQRTQSSNGFYGVFVCEDRYGNECLRKTENPAHNEWVASNWRENGKISQKGRNAVNEVDEFIIAAMEKLFSNKDKKVQNIQGLEEFLYIPTAIDDDDDDSESLIGDIIGDRDNEGNSLSTELSDITKDPIEDKPSIGKVMIVNPQEQPQQRDIDGNALSGHGTQHKRHSGDGGVTPKTIDSRYTGSLDGVEGTFLKEIPVTYRSFAQSENGKIVHNIIIHSDFDIDNGRIDLLVGGEQSDDVVEIKSCEPTGIINDNTISGLRIQKGKNILKVKFADNMKHAIKLDAYELK